MPLQRRALQPAKHQTSAHRFVAAQKPLSPKDHPNAGRLCIPHAVCRTTIPAVVRHRHDRHQMEWIDPLAGLWRARRVRRARSQRRRSLRFSLVLTHHATPDSTAKWSHQWEGHLVRSDLIQQCAELCAGHGDSMSGLLRYSHRTDDPQDRPGRLRRWRIVGKVKHRDAQDLWKCSARNGTYRRCIQRPA